MSVAKVDIKPYIAGCGVRRHGQAYLTTNMREWREVYELNHFVLDPPVLIGDKESLANWGLCDQGVAYIDQYDTATGKVITHAMTVVGRESYPNVADILEEWEAGWASTLVPLIGNDIHKLTPESRLYIVHASGWMDNWKVYRDEYLKTPRPPCMLAKDDPVYCQHLDGDDMCAGLHWQNVFTGVRYLKHDRYVERTIGQTVYQAVGPIKDNMPVYKYAIVAWRPIDSITVVDSEDIQDKSPVEKALEFLSASTAIPIYVANH